MGNIQILGMLLILLGIGLMIGEAFIPSFGIVGVSGIIFIVSGLIMFTDSLLIGLIILIIILALVGIVMFIIYRVISTKGSPLVLSDMLKEDGPEYTRDLINKRGLVHTPLRPSGTVIIDGKKYDVIAEGEFIERNTEVIVENIIGKKILVKSIKK